MEVGQFVVRHPITCMSQFEQFPNLAKPMWGKIVYVHPQGRYHTVEFMVNGYTFRESFSIYDLVPGDTFYNTKRHYDPRMYEKKKEKKHTCGEEKGTWMGWKDANAAAIRKFMTSKS